VVGLDPAVEGVVGLDPAVVGVVGLDPTVDGVVGLDPSVVGVVSVVCFCVVGEVDTKGVLGDDVIPGVVGVVEELLIMVTVHDELTVMFKLIEVTSTL
jgi:hypothetical protein